MTELTPNTKTRIELEKFSQLVDTATHKQWASLTPGLSPISLALAYQDWLAHLSSSPGYRLLRQYDAWQALQRAAEKNLDLCKRPWQSDELDTDTRFKDRTWTQWPYSVVKNNFKTTEQWWRQCAQIDGMHPHHQHVVNFFTRQIVDAMSPSNTTLTNPEVLRVGIESLGMSFAKGMQHYLHDQYKNLKQKTLSSDEQQLDPLPYEVGVDVAITPGKVIFKNELIELIQYAPSTDQVQAEPLLIVPSCIMKYYILDLSPHNSMVRYLVDQGFTVFMISWRNPDEHMRDVGIEDYLTQGVLEALAQIKTQSHAMHVHSMGYCLGGTFLSIAAAWLAKSSTSTYPTLASVTLLAAQTDFTEPGELGVFIDEDQLKSLREEMNKTGYLSGRQMADSFRFLNARDLIWTHNVQRYLLGKDENGNDMMSWNADHTRLPERMHNEYLTHFFLHNALADGQYRLQHTAIALLDIEAPMMVVSTVRDHVSPWRSVYKIHLLTDTDITFVLASGGHNAGIISEPGHPHRHYQIGHTSKDYGWTHADEWADSAPSVEGSWWLAWSEWLTQNSSHQVKARAPSTKHALCDAPGEYVMTRYAN